MKRALWIVGLVCGVGAGAAEAQDQAGDDLRRQLSRIADIDRRLEACNEAVRRHPNAASVLTLRAAVRLDEAQEQALDRISTPMEQAAGAIEDLDRALAINPGYNPAKWERVQLDLAQADPISADLRLQGMTADPGPFGALAQGQLALLENRPDAALAYFDEALVRDPTCREAFMARAKLRIRRGQYEGAMEDAEAVRRRDPCAADAWVLKGEARWYGLTDERETAEAEIERGLSMTPGDPYALGCRAMIRLRRDENGEVRGGDLRRARDEAYAALQVDPLSAWIAQMVAAELAWAEDELQEGIMLAQTATDMAGLYVWEPTLLRARMRMLTDDTGEYEPAQIDLAQVIDSTDGIETLEEIRARAMVDRATLLIELDRAEEALEQVEEALDLHSNVPEGYFQRGRARIRGQNRDYESAKQDFTQALTREREFADAFFYRAVCHHDTGLYEEAIRDLRQAELLFEKERGYFGEEDMWMLRGHCYFEMDQWDDAKEAYREYMGLAEDDHRARRKVEDRMILCDERLGEAPPDDED